MMNTKATPSIARATMALTRVMRMPSSIKRDYVIAQLLGFLANETGHPDLASFLLTAHTMQRFEDDGLDHSILVPDIEEFTEQLMKLGEEVIAKLQQVSEERAPYEELKAQQVALLDTFKRMKNDLVRAGEMTGEVVPEDDDDLRDIPSFKGFNIKSTLSGDQS